MLKLVKEAEYQQIKDYCFERYGIEESSWDKYVLIKKKEALWLCPQKILQLDCSFFEVCGTRLFSGTQFPYKITDVFCKIFKNKIRKGIVDLDAKSLKKLLFEKEIQLQEDPQQGYVVLKFQDYFVGVGLKRGGHLLSQVPKRITAQLSENLEFCDK